MRCSALAVTLLLLPNSAAQAQDEAKKLYEAMEQKVAKAKVQKFDFDMDTIGGSDGQLKVKGTLIVAAGNRLKVTIAGQQGDFLTFQGIVVSDGKVLVYKGESNGKPDETRSTPVADTMSEVVSGWLARAGLFVALDQVEKSKPKEPGSVQLANFKILGKEKVDGRDSNVISYVLTPGDGKKETATCKLWLDVQTNLPLKRVTEANNGKFRSVEMYRGWEIDPKLPDGTFTPPK
jgi:outer membrane lipoprotein-sorting protein